MKIVTKNGYILGVGRGSGGITIDDAQAERLIEIFARKLIATDGYDYRLRADTLEWELCELPPMPEDDEATIEDYEAALAEVGV